MLCKVNYVNITSNTINNIKVIIDCDKKYEDFLSDYNKNNYYIDQLKIYNLYECEIIDLNSINLFELDIWLNDNLNKYILPTKLTKLIVRNTNNKNSIYILNNLPSGLKHLEIKYILNYNKSAIYPKLDYLPSSIETLVLPGDYQNNLENLPNSIKNIIFTNVRYSHNNYVYIDFSYLSDYIEQLNISKLYDYNKKIIKLPKGLKKLLIVLNFDGIKLIPDYYSCFYDLDNLLYLKTNIIIPNELLTNFKKLKYLNFWFDGNLSDLNNIMPKSLEYLSIKYYNINKNLDNKYFEYNNLILGLTNLKYLKFKLTHNVDSEKCFVIKNLPESLLTLTIIIQNQLEKIEIDHLPLKLKYLKITSDSNHKLQLINDYFNELPPNLKYLFFTQIKNYDILPNSLIWLDTNTYCNKIKKLSNLQYLTIRKKTNSKILNFEPNTCLTHLNLNLEIDDKIPHKLILNGNLEVLLLNLNINVDNFNQLIVDELKNNEIFLLENINFSPSLKIFGLAVNYFSNKSNLFEDKKILMEYYLKQNFKLILNNIPDSVKVLGFEEFCDKIPIIKFPKSLNKIYMEHRASSLCYSFENESIYSTIETNIYEYRTETKRGESPLICMYRDYFYTQLDNFKKSNEYWEDY